MNMIFLAISENMQTNIRFSLKSSCFVLYEYIKNYLAQYHIFSKN